MAAMKARLSVIFSDSSRYFAPCGLSADEAQGPAMDVVQVGVAAAGEGAQQVQVAADWP
jgi:hypothetical protein